MRFSNRFAVAASSLLVYTVAVVLWGAYVRASLSGDGCGDHWPLCNGVALPVEPSIKTIVELTHRVTSGLCWIGTLLMWVVAGRVFERGHATRSAAGWSLFFMTTEALVGAGLVLFRMVADNPSTARAAWMSAHLINTFMLLAALTWMAFSAWQSDGVRFPRDRQSRWLLGGAATVVLFVGVSGAVAALGDTLFPASSLAEGLREDLSPTSHLFLRLRLWHPVIAVLGSGYLIWLATVFLRRTRDPGVRMLTFTLGGLVLIQIAVGLLNVALLAPVWTQLVHLLIADATWITLVLLALSSPPPTSDASLLA
ncbi:MAG: COX15/CtaA family protein [Deltaproteobacteria bacterium]